MTTPDPRFTRRDALRLAAAGVVLPTFAGCRTGDRSSVAPGTGHIDAHSHVWTPDTGRFPLGRWMTRSEMQPASFTAEELLAIARPCGVERVVLIQHAPYYGDDNSYLIDCVRRFPGRFSVVAIVDERRADLGLHLRVLRRQGVRGIRIGPARYADRTLVKDPQKWLEAPAMRDLWRLATDEGLVLCPLISAEYLPSLDRMLSDFPATTVALDHFAHAQQADHLADLARLARHPTVHVKVSGFYKFGDRQPPYDDLAPMIRTVHQTFGPDRMLWGSDCPYQLLNGNDYPRAVALIGSGLGFLDAQARMKVLRTTAERLFFT